MRSQSATDRLIGELATRQYGVVGRGQLLGLCIQPGAVARRLQQGRLHPVHRGVYTVGHRVLGPQGRWMAAVLACGEGAVLSHDDAADAWRIGARTAGVVTPIDVTTPSGGGRKRPGIRAHRGRLHPEDVTSLAAVPITTPSRTLVDLAARAIGDREIERALDEARYLKLLDRDTLEATMRRTTRGARALRRVLATHVPGTTRTRSGLEEAFLALVRSTGLPQPEVNAPVGRMTVDFLWRFQRLVVETDGAVYHDTPSRLERDRRRDSLLERWGYTVLRVAEADLRERPLAIVQVVTRALDDAGAGSA